MPASTIHRLLTTLAAHGLAEADEINQTWTIGIEALRIGAAFQRKMNLVQAARSHMQELMERTGETVNMALLDKEEVVFIAQIECHEPLRAFFRTGERRAMHASGIGKSLMAQMSVDKLSSLLKKRHLEKFTNKTITDPAQLYADLKLTRQRGWSLDDEEAHTGMRCIAAPIFNEYGEAIAGISLSGPVARLSGERIPELGQKIRTYSDKITWSIGGQPPIH